MKKKTNGFVSVLLALCLLLAPMTVFAESNAQLNYVTDDAGILTDSQWEDLEQRAQQVSEEYQCGVYMITVDDYTDYSTEPPQPAVADLTGMAGSHRKSPSRTSALGQGEGTEKQLLSAGERR